MASFARTVPAVDIEMLRTAALQAADVRKLLQNLPPTAAMMSTGLHATRLASE
jgi:hypothetical protein